VQVAFAMQLYKSLQILRAIALLALAPLPEITIDRLSVISSSRHVPSPL
jgi:hypothetical protein